MGAALVIASVLGTAASVQQGRKASKAQEKSQKIQQKQQAMQTARERRKQYRAARQAQAELAATSFAQGTSATSRTASIGGNIQQEAATNVGFLNQSEGFTSAIGQQNIKSAQATSRANTYGAIAGLGFQAAEFGMKAEGTGLFDKTEA